MVKIIIWADEAYRPSPYILSDKGQKMQKKIWRELSEHLERIEPGIMKNVTI